MGGEPLPWAYGLFIGQMNLGADKITYSAKNAFSLGFADDVWAVRPEGKETDLELFVSARPSAAAARKLADQLRASFKELGAPAGKAAGVPLIKDQFLGLLSTATTLDRITFGLRGAASVAVATAELERLRKTLASAPPELLARAVPGLAGAAAAPAAEKAPAAATPAEPSEADEEK